MIDCINKYILYCKLVKKKYKILLYIYINIYINNEIKIINFCIEFLIVAGLLQFVSEKHSPTNVDVMEIKIGKVFFANFIMSHFFKI